MAGETMNETYEKLVKQMQLLADWRDSIVDKRKARAIQKVIEKKLPEVIPTYSYRPIGDVFCTQIHRTREEFMYLYELRARDWRADHLSVSLRRLGRR